MAWLGSPHTGPKKDGGWGGTARRRVSRSHGRPSLPSTPLHSTLSKVVRKGRSGQAWRLARRSKPGTEAGSGGRATPAPGRDEQAYVRTERDVRGKQAMRRPALALPRFLYGGAASRARAAPPRGRRAAKVAGTQGTRARRGQAPDAHRPLTMCIRHAGRALAQGEQTAPLRSGAAPSSPNEEIPG